ncbi:MAG: ATP-binding protein [Bacilli bacterium]|nr:ATP-binding protein [Bacilli bacterium]
MLGTIIGIEEDTVLLKLSIDLDKFQSLINLHVVMEDNDKMLVGEIADIKNGIAYVNLVGEIVNDEFVFGVIRKPSFGAVVKLISKEKIPMIISVSDYQEKKDVLIGESPIYSGVKIGFDINSFFASHFAVFGSTGSGKSWGVAKLLQSIFDKQRTVAYRASIFIFDAYGEYHSAFKDISKKVPEVSFKTYTTNTKLGDTEILKIPLWLLTTDDIALLLGAESPTQLPIIEKALKLVSVFAQDEKEVIKQKNDIIARVILDILSSGHNAAQIRDQIFSVLSTYKTKDLNLDTQIYQPGYVRSLKQCLIIDASGKIREIELITNFMQSFLDNSISLTLPDGSFKYTLDDLKLALDFALLSEGALNSDKVYDECNVLKVRLHSLLNGEYAKYFACDKYVTIDEYIKDLLMAPNGRKAQIINFNINYVDDRFAKIITKIYSKLLFDYAKNLEKRASLPFHIILEEAHRYVQNDNDVKLLGYNIFERIAKEGRKYGVLLGLISQRPSDLSETCISQCNNFLIFKMLHPRDIQYIKDMVPNITNEIVKRLRILQPGNCIGFGSAFHVPVLIKMDKPMPAPSSNSCDVSANWFIDRG